MSYTKEELTSTKYKKSDLAELVLELQQSSKAQPSDKDDQNQPSNNLDTVVIPFKKSMAKGDELRYALRAWEENFGNCKVVIIGDAPDFPLSELVSVLAVTESSNNPQIDVALKMAAAIASDLVPEEFIWSNDDIYPTTSVIESDVRLITALGVLKAVKNGRIYDNNRINTIKGLKEHQLPIFDYATHTPVVFNKAMLAQVLEEFNCFEQGHLVSSLYFNYWFPDVYPIMVHNGGSAAFGNYVVSVFRQGVDPKVIATEAKRRKFLNNNDAGWPATQVYLKKAFPKACEFEAK